MVQTEKINSEKSSKRSFTTEEKGKGQGCLQHRTSQVTKKNTKHNQLSSQNSQQWSQADMLFKGRVPQNAVTTACTREVYAIELSYPFAALVCEDDS